LLFENKPTIALTGATGFLGSHLMATLLSKGYNIIVFGRSAKNESLEERISRLLQWFGIDSCLDQVTCVDTDLSQDNLGIPTGEYLPPDKPLSYNNENHYEVLRTAYESKWSGNYLQSDAR
jgi:nucleoside-diphosphate-sugar epimerase